ncbi:MAG TPA: tyrosine-type recombinase/integrase [Herpetosiphonaceae bacterium]
MTNTILDRYLADLQQRPNRSGRLASPATIRAARADLQGFINWWEQAHRVSFDVAHILDRDLRAWQRHRQREDGAKPATINRAQASLRAFFAWAQQEGLIAHNPTAELHDLPIEDGAPRSLPPTAVEWLVRAASAQPDATARLRDLALITLLSECGLRSQEAADVQLRDLDLDGAMLAVRSGKGGKGRRVPLTVEAVRRLREYLKVRCPSGLPPIGSAAEREPLLMKRTMTKAGAPWEPGLQPVSMRKHLGELGRAAAELLRARAAKEPSLQRVAELEALARHLVAVSPHQLRHGLAYRLWKQATPAHVQRILGHSRVSTTLKYGKPTEDDLRDALEEANRIS